MFGRWNKDGREEEYTGNVFGWKISIIGLVVIALLAALAAYRTYSLDVPVGFEDPLKDQVTPFDETRRRDSIRAARALERDSL